MDAELAAGTRAHRGTVEKDERVYHLPALGPRGKVCQRISPGRHWKRKGMPRHPFFYAHLSLKP